MSGNSFEQLNGVHSELVEIGQEASGTICRIRAPIAANANLKEAIGMLSARETKGGDDGPHDEENRARGGQDGWIRMETR